MRGKFFKLLLPCLLLGAMLCSMLPTAVFASGTEGSLSTVYLDGTNGLDTNDGTSAGTAVQTFDEAKRLLNTTDGTIYISGQVNITGAENWDLTGYTNAMVKRDAGFSNISLIKVISGGSLTLSNITIDGNKEGIDPEAGTSPLIEVSGGSLTMNDGAILQNNIGGYCGGVALSSTGSSFTMNGGKITDNDATGNAGGVYLAQGSFIMYGGEISNNTAAGNGGGIYTAPGPAGYIASFDINGGIITGNTAASGSAIYHSAKCQINIGTPTISGSIYLNSTTRSLNITTALASGLTVQSKSPAENVVVAKGLDYTLTESDRSKFSYDGGGWYFWLDTDNNSIYLAENEPSITYNVTFSGDNATVYIDGSPVTTGEVTRSGSLTFSVTPAGGYKIMSVTASNGTITDNGGGSYTLSEVTEDATVTVNSVLTSVYNITFEASNAAVYVDSSPVSAALTGADSSLTFTVTPDSGYRILSVTSDSGAITDNGGGSYTVSGVSGDATVTVLTADADADLTIYTAEELFAFAADVNSGNDYSGRVVRLGADIDLKNAPWTPIGYYTPYDPETYTPGHSNYFRGIFDGGGYTVSGIMINNPSGYEQGFFGVIWNATIKNLTVDGRITGGFSSTGGIAGTAGSSDIINCINNAAVSGERKVGGIAGAMTGYLNYGIYGCTNNGDIYGTKDAIGGIAGFANRIVNCANHGAVSGGKDIFEDNSTGGIMGGTSNAGGTFLIDRCCNSGTVTGSAMYCGGISGRVLYTTISNCYNTGTVKNICNSGSAKDPSCAGGIVARLYFQSDTACTVENCYNTGSVQHTGLGPGIAEDICARSDSGILTNNYTHTATFSAADLGSAYVEDSTSINNGYPVLAWQVAAPAIYRVTFDTADTVTVTDSESQTIDNSGTPGTYTLAAGTYSYSTSGGAKGSFNVIDNNLIIKLTANAVFDTVPPGASVTLQNSGGQTIANNGTEGSYSDIPNDTYTYTVTMDGYTTVSGSLLIAGIDRDMAVTMADSSLVYNVTIDSSITNGTVAVNPSGGTAGTEVTVSITPNEGKQLVEGSLRYTTDIPNSGWTAITQSEGVYSFVIPTGNVTVTAQFEKIPTELFSITKTPITDPIWAIFTDVSEAMEGDVVTVTIADTTVVAWATGIIVTGDISGQTYEFTTITASADDTVDTNKAGVYQFIMPGEPVTVSFTPQYSLLKVYLQIGNNAKTLVHAYTRAEMEAMAETNTEPVYYSMWNREPQIFMGKAVSYVTLEQLAASAAAYNSAVRFNDADCILKAKSVDGWTFNRDWTYLMDTVRSYYHTLGDQYLAEENRTGQNSAVPVVLAITGWGGEKTYVDNQPYDTLNAYRLWYGLSAEQYDDGGLPTSGELDDRSTANDMAKWVNEITFVVPQTYSVTADDAVSGGSISADPAVCKAGTTVTVTVTPDEGQQFLSGTLKYTIDGGTTYRITPTEGTYSFTMPESNVTITAGFTDIGAPNYNVTIDNTITGGTISVDTGTGPAGTEVIISITPEADKRLLRGSLKYTVEGGGDYTVTSSGGVYSFVLPSGDVTLTGRFEEIPDAVYTVTPQPDNAYSIGSTMEGIPTMTVKEGVSGFKLFKVNITPVTPHSGMETVVFIHMRDGVQLEYVAVAADFDRSNHASAGFNVQEGDVIQVLVVEEMLNEPGFIPIIFM
jgi:hypothetical protein